MSEGRLWFQYVGYDYAAYMYYMDLDFRRARKAIEFNHSLTQFEKQRSRSIAFTLNILSVEVIICFLNQWLRLWKPLH